MSIATPFPWPASPSQTGQTTFHAVFERAPVAVARCNSQGLIVEMNPAFERALDRSVAGRRSLRIGELVRPQDRDKTELLLHDLFDRQLDRISIEAHGPGHVPWSAKWTAWLQPGCAGEPDHALLIAEPPSPPAPVEEALLQGQRWEAMGRLTGGVVHDFNNLLTGVMLYCDLLLSSLDGRDCRRRYADEIRAAIVQATGLVRQLLVFTRPQSTPARLLSLNETATTMRDLLSRLIGENISLDLQLDPGLGFINIDQAQLQQILLNLVLNARDALPNGGRIVIETSNCKFQPLAGPAAPGGRPAFPCVLLVVADNGCGMSAETRQRIFEPFFTTKNAGQGTGLGLTTVRSIVTTNRGLIEFDSEPGRGTRVLVLLPRACSPEPRLIDTPGASAPSPTLLQKVEKESHL